MLSSLLLRRIRRLWLLNSHVLDVVLLVILAVVGLLLLRLIMAMLLLLTAATAPFVTSL
jgi:hypothetical protein